MDECPHCGEPIDNDAESCPHCGSDYETGWKPDADYYSLELPDEEAERGSKGYSSIPELRWERGLGRVIVLTAAAAFAWIGGRAHGTIIIPFVLLLAVCGWIFCRWLRSRHA